MKTINENAYLRNEDEIVERLTDLEGVIGDNSEIREKYNQLLNTIREIMWCYKNMAIDADKALNQLDCVIKTLKGEI